MNLLAAEEQGCNQRNHEVCSVVLLVLYGNMDSCEYPCLASIWKATAQAGTFSDQSWVVLPSPLLRFDPQELAAGVYEDKTAACPNGNTASYLWFKIKDPKDTDTPK